MLFLFKFFFLICLFFFIWFGWFVIGNAVSLYEDICAISNGRDDSIPYIREI